MSAATDYDIHPTTAERLMGVVSVPSADIRRQALEQMRQEGIDLALLFAEFIGLANSVVANNRDMIEIILITEGMMHPYEAEKANLPTIFGALNGVKLAAGIDASKVCAGCAFRTGSPANQSPVTTIDADDAASGELDVFMCHEDLDEKGVPTHACPGYAQAVVARRKAADRASLPTMEAA